MGIAIVRAMRHGWRLTATYCGGEALLHHRNTLWGIRIIMCGGKVLVERV